MTRSNFSEHQEARIERFKELAEKNHALSDQTCDQACRMADVIPFGQPILIGHHSEKRDRNYRDRIGKKFEKSAELEEKAKYYDRRVQAAENGKLAISSDDPEAIRLLKEKLEKLQKFQDHAKIVNKIVRKKVSEDEKVKLLIESGLKKETARKCLLPDSFGNIGIPAYKLTNNNGNMKRIKDRIAQLERESKEVTTETVIGDITIMDSIEDNRVMITFPGIPDESIRTYLKSCGFRWSPSNQAWQAYRSAGWQIPYIVKRLTVMPAYVNPDNYLFAEMPKESIQYDSSEVGS